MAPTAKKNYSQEFGQMLRYKRYSHLEIAWITTLAIDYPVVYQKSDLIWFYISNL